MKKILTSISVALLAVLLCIAFSGCATNVSGKTYEYSDITVEYAADLSDTEKKIVDAAVELSKVALNGATITFNEDGTISGTYSELSGGYWTQDGKTVTIYSDSGKTVELMSFSASGSKLTCSDEYYGSSLTLIFAKQ